MKKAKKSAKSVKLSGSEIAVNVLFWAAMTFSVIGLIIYGGYQIFRWREGKALHYFRLNPKSAPVKAQVDVISNKQNNREKTSSYKNASSKLTKSPAQKEEEIQKEESLEGASETSIEADKNMMKGLIIRFKDAKNEPISAEKQAKFFLDRALKDLDKLEDHQGVGLTYSANYGQTKALAAAYLNGKYTAGVKGSNQATVVKAIENLLRKDEKYKPLRYRLHIIPITTLGYGEENPEEIIIRDMENLACHLGAGWRVYGWQNQDTNFKTSKKFAVGGGIVKTQSKRQYQIIQNSLLSLSERKDLLEKNSSELQAKWAGGVDTKVARRYKAAILLGERDKDPLAFLRICFEPTQSQSLNNK